MTDLTPAPVNKSHPSRDPATQFGEPVVWLRSEIDRLFGDFEKPARSAFGFSPRLALVPALELVDDETSYRLTAEIPGLAEKDVEISLADGVLSISGEKKVEEERKDGLPAERASLWCLPARNPASRRYRSQRHQGQVQGRRADRDPEQG
jgi:HSP20 family protein